MGRRFRRLRQLGQQVIKVTRRIAHICSCCGTFPSETEEFVVPVASVIGNNGNISTKYRVRIVDHQIFCKPVRTSSGDSKRGGSVTGLTERSNSPEELPNVPDIVWPSSDRNGSGTGSHSTDTSSSLSQLDNLSLLDSPGGEIVNYGRHPRVDTFRELVPSNGLNGSYQIQHRCPVPLLENLHSSSDTSVEYTNCSKLMLENSSSETTGCYKVSASKPMPQKGLTVGNNLSSSEFSSDDAVICQQNQIPLKCATLVLTPVSPLPKSIVSSSNVKVEHAFPDFWKNVCPDDWTVLKTLSRGNFGLVELAVLKDCSRRIVVKTCDAFKSLHEANILFDCQSPYVVRLHASMMVGNERHICMQYHEMGDLHQFFKKDGSRNYFTELGAIWIISYVVVAVEYLHGKGVMHLDIKPSNILIDAKGYPVLTDFGSARRTNCREISKGLSITAAYVCPEILQGEEPTVLADLWATACTLYELIKGSTPFKGINDSETRLKICLGIVPDFSGMSPAVADFLKYQLHPSKEERLGYNKGAFEVMRHPVFEDIEWENVRYGHRQNDSPIFSLLEKIREINEGQILCHNDSQRIVLTSSSCDSVHGVRRKPPRPRRKKPKKQRNVKVNKRLTEQPDDESYFGDNEECDKGKF